MRYQNRQSIRIGERTIACVLIVFLIYGVGETQRTGYLGKTKVSSTIPFKMVETEKKALNGKNIDEINVDKVHI